MITNHSVEAAESVRVTFTAYDVRGSSVGVANAVVGRIGAGGRMGVGAILAITSAPVTTVRATAAPAFWTSTGARHTMSGEGAQIQSQNDGNPNDHTVDGGRGSTYPRSYASVPRYAVCVGSSGRIVGAGAGEGPVVAAGGIPTSASVPVYAQAPASCQIYGPPTAP